MNTAHKQASGSGIRRKGFTLVETLTAIAVIAFVAGVGIFVYTGSRKAASQHTMSVSLNALNQSVKIYRISGGSLAGIDDTEAVVAKLQSVASDGSQREIVGIAGTMLDSNVRPVFHPEGQPLPVDGIYWEPSERKFVGIAAGDSIEGKAIIGFEYADDNTAVARAKEDRRTTQQFNNDPGWVWGYSESSVDQGAGVSDVPTSPVGGGGFGFGGGDPPTDPSSPERLEPPTFTLPGGSFTYNPFIYTTIENPNPAGSSSIFYKRGEDGEWQSYSDEFIFVRPGTETVYAYCVAIDTAAWIDSFISEETYSMDDLFFTGDVTGRFSNPEGPNGMVYNIWHWGRNSFFSWGTPSDPHDDPSWLYFQGLEFDDVAVDEQFTLGRLTYFNGTIWTGTEADNVDLSLYLDVEVPTLTESLTYTLELINTINYYWQSANQNADYVYLPNLWGNLETELNGEEYYLQLSFGNHTSHSFTYIDEFHVYEGAIASGDLIGTFTRTPWSGTGG
ncbi:MAG: choice-of-anchor K domain-containing protein [Verrucomicrobiales bacterium]